MLVKDKQSKRIGDSLYNASRTYRFGISLISHRRDRSLTHPPPSHAQVPVLLAGDHFCNPYALVVIFHSLPSSQYQAYKLLFKKYAKSTFDLTFRILKCLSIRELLVIELLVCFYSMTTPVPEYLLHDQVSRKWQRVILPSCSVETPLLENDCK